MIRSNSLLDLILFHTDTVCKSAVLKFTAVAKVITEIENSLRSACFMKSRLVRNELLLILGANNFKKKSHIQKKKLFHHKDTPGNFLNWHDWLNSLLASAFSSVSTLFVTVNACVLNQYQYQYQYLFSIKHYI